MDGLGDELGDGLGEGDAAKGLDEGTGAGGIITTITVGEGTATTDGSAGGLGIGLAWGSTVCAVREAGSGATGFRVTKAFCPHADVPMTTVIPTNCFNHRFLFNINGTRLTSAVENTIVYTISQLLVSVSLQPFMSLPAFADKSLGESARNPQCNRTG
jgi:hypothetical protein